MNVSNLISIENGRSVTRDTKDIEFVFITTPRISCRVDDRLKTVSKLAEYRYTIKRRLTNASFDQRAPPSVRQIN